MSQNIPKVGQAFVYPVVLKLDGAILADPSAVYAAGDVTAWFGTSATEVTLSAARRGTTPVLDITISAAQHTDSPVLIRIEDRDGTTFDDEYVTLFTNKALKYKADANYAYITDSADTVLAHAPLLKVGGLTTHGAFVDGDVP